MKKIFIITTILVSCIFMVQCKKNKKDTTPPQITLTEPLSQNVALDSPYVEPGYKAIDDKDGDITSKVTIKSDVNTSVEGTYYRYYDVKDASGNSAITVQRKVVVVIF